MIIRFALTVYPYDDLPPVVGSCCACSESLQSTRSSHQLPEGRYCRGVDVSSELQPMKSTLVMAGLFLLVGASPASFDSRLESGRQAISTEQGKAYDASLGPTIGQALRACVPPGSPSRIGKFALVGTVASSGAVSAIEVRPVTSASRCFAKQISAASLPAPPFSPFPLVIEISIIP